MNPTQVLKNEHRVIECVLDVLEKMSEKARTEKTLDADSAHKAIDFFKNFADQCHHGKEEVHLFTWMEEQGFPRDGGPTGVMLHEHEIGRSHVRAMKASIDEAAQGDEKARIQFVDNAQGFIPMLREHIQKEDHCLFPMADNHMSDEQRNEMMNRFHHTEKEDMGEGKHEHWIEVAKTLAQRYEVPFNVPTEACGCAHHAS
ncbi:hemerythrin [bacterium]|nr:hemerythrin [bacterium]